MNKNRNRIAAMMMVAAITVSSVTIPVEAAVVNSNVSSKVVENTRGTEKDVTDGVVLNEENFPDENFRKYLSEEFNVQEGNIISAEKLNNTEKIDLNIKYEKWLIKDLSGIKYFKNLKSLDCSSHQIKDIDLSNNIELKELKCSNCFIKELNLNKNINLEHLECDDNTIENIDISKLKNLKYLNYSNNNIQNINLSENINLETLICNDNNISNINLKANVSLINLEGNSNNITNIDISKNTNLETLILMNNSIETIDLNNNNKLYRINLESNKLKEINMENKPNLQYMNLCDNELKEINLPDNKKWEDIDLSVNKLRNLDLSKIGNIDNYPEISIESNEIGKLKVNEYNRMQIYPQDIDFTNEKFDNYIDLNKEFGITQEDINNNKVEVKTEGITLDGTKLRWKDKKPAEIKYVYNCGGRNNKTKLYVCLHLEGGSIPDPFPNPDDNKPITPSTPSVKPDTNHSKIVGGDRYETAAKIADQMGS
ncbi:leucine-rich repeat domain-containing protein, partial [Peptacetobacter sp.]|uniref:leucine-rich repeat domain-containing protein n=1 Tax=Peptacetobacter sp. TaxID=2991975 RepID=UPI002ED3D7DC